MAGNMTIKVSGLSRDDLRAIDRKAKAEGRTRAAWCRLGLVDLSRQPEPAKALPASNGGVLDGVVSGDASLDGDYILGPGISGPTLEPRRHPVPTPRKPLIQSYEPD